MKNKALKQRLAKRLKLTNKLSQLKTKTAYKALQVDYKPVTTTPTKIIQG